MRRYVAESHYQPLRGLSDWIASRSSSGVTAAAARPFDDDVYTTRIVDIREPALLEPRSGYVFLRAGVYRPSFNWWEFDETRIRVRSSTTERGWSGATDSRFFPKQSHFEHSGNTTTGIAMTRSSRSSSSSNAWACPMTYRSWSVHFSGRRHSFGRCDQRELFVTAIGSNTIGPSGRSGYYSAFRVRHRRRTFDSNATSCRVRRAAPATRDRTIPLRRPAARSRTPPRQRGRARARLAQFGFQSIEPDRLSFWEQVERFRAAECVVTAHGAALANLVHRADTPTGLIELFPNEKDFLRRIIGPWLSRESGFAYRAVVGSAMSPGRGFSVSWEAVAQAVESVLRELDIAEPTSFT